MVCRDLQRVTQSVCKLNNEQLPALQHGSLGSYARHKSLSLMYCCYFVRCGNTLAITFNGTGNPRDTS